jgi:hypothetical protein
VHLRARRRRRRLFLRVKGCPQELRAGRAYVHLFKAM